MFETLRYYIQPSSKTGDQMRVQFMTLLLFVFHTVFSTFVVASPSCEIEISKAEIILVQSINHLVNAGQTIDEFGEVRLTLSGPVTQISYRTAMPGELSPNEISSATVTSGIVQLKVSKLMAIILDQLNERMGLQIQLTTLEIKPTDLNGEACVIKLNIEKAVVKKESRSISKTPINLSAMQEIYELAKKLEPKIKGYRFPQSKEFAKQMFEILLRNPTPKVTQLLSVSGFSNEKAIELAVQGLFNKFSNFVMIWNHFGGDYGAYAILDGMVAAEDFGLTDVKTAHDIFWVSEAEFKGHTKIYTVWSEGNETVQFEAME